MTTYIVLPSGAYGPQSHNLRAMLSYARTGGGVARIDIFDTGSEKGRPGALVRVAYRNGAYAEDYFVCLSHAKEWAAGRRDSSPRKSWFAGCQVETHTLARFRAWDWSRVPGAPIEGIAK